MGFRLEDARLYGLLAAVLLNDLEMHIAFCEGHKDGYNDGKKFWVRMSLDEWQSTHDYVTKRQIRDALKTLEEMGAILTSNFNENPFDKTMWYTLNK